jgi:hypothetical protein
MRLIGKNAFTLYPLNERAISRLSLWCQEVKSARWQTFDDVALSKLEVKQIDANRVRFYLRAADICVDTLLQFVPPVVCVVQVQTIGEDDFER